ncbi:MAG: hypothetical protein U5L06_00005, partial [Rhodovibrio sp.]|nr:hypothetical protein [Rhodovibrio sp.]
MIDQSQAPALEAYLNQHPRDAEGLGPAVKWEERGWPSSDGYRPIAEAAAMEAAGLPILAANPEPGARPAGRRPGRLGALD